MNKQAVAKELVAVARELTALDAVTGEKVYYWSHRGRGRGKYSVSFHDGVKTHRDESPFYDIALFSNKKALQLFIRGLKQEGYREER